MEAAPLQIRTAVLRMASPGGESRRLLRRDSFLLAARSLDLHDEDSDVVLGGRRIGFRHETADLDERRRRERPHHAVQYLRLDRPKLGPAVAVAAAAAP